MRSLLVALVAPLLAPACGDSGDDDPPGGADAGADAAAEAGPEPDAGPPHYEDADAFFAADTLPEIELTLPPESMSALERQPGIYQRGIVRVGDVVVQDVGIRLKGVASFRDLGGKAAFKVKMDEFVDGQRLFGLRRLTLNNLVQDPSGVRERLGYRFMRAAGVTAPRCNGARVFVNGEYWGLYANVESLDDELVESRFGTEAGNLYDITDYFVDLLPGSEPGFELETNRAAADRSDLEALIAAVGHRDGSFLDDAEPVLDVEAVLRLGATQAMIADWDGYFGARNNYKLYHEVASDRFLLLPWGIDQTFGASDSAPYFRGSEYDIYGTSSDRYNGWLFVRCKDEPACLARYQQAVAAALETWTSLPLVAELDAMEEQIRDAVADDPRRESSVSDFEGGIRQVRAFLEERAAVVQAQLDGPLPELCENQVDDDGDGDVDCDDAACVPPTDLPFQGLCAGGDDSCAGAPPPAEAAATITVSGAIVTAELGGLAGATIEILAAEDETVLASTISGADGSFSVSFDTGGVPAEVIVRESMDGRIPNRHVPPPLWDDYALFLDVLLSPEELDALAAGAGIVPDLESGILALEAVDCAGDRLFNPAIDLTPAPPEVGEAILFGVALLFGVPPGQVEATGTFEDRPLGPASLAVVAGEITSARLTP